MALTLSGDDGVAGVNGSATTPAIQGTDTNTGLTFGTDEVNVVTGGSTRTTVDSSGRLLVGTSTARNTFFNDTNITPVFQVEGANSATDRFISQTYGSAGADNGIFVFAKHRSNSKGGITVVQNNDGLGQIDFQGSDGTNFVSSARIRALVDGTPGADDMPGRLEFSTTADGASSPTERMRINSSGELHSSSYTTDGWWLRQGATGSASTPMMRFRASSADTRYHIEFSQGTSTVGSISATSGGTSYNTSSDYRLKENVVDLDGAIDRVKQLAPKRFNFIVDPDKTVDGFIAHEAQTVVPEAVTGVKDEVEVWQENETLPDGLSVGDNKLDEDGNTIPLPQGIDQSKLVPLLTAALQEAIGKIEALETRVAQLEGGAS